MELIRSTGCVWLIFCLLFQAVPVSGNNQSALMDFLFTSYENSVRPVCGQSQPIEVKIGLAIRQVIELDEPKQILYLNAWMRLQWSDCQLQWTPTNYANIAVLKVPYEKVWTPDITLYDNAAGELPGVKDYRVAVYSDGSMYYNYPTIISVLCKMDVTYFPYDTQKCALMFGSWSHHGLEVDVTNRSSAGDISNFVPNSEFDITSVPVERHVITYSCCPEPYPDVTFYVHLKRKPSFYVFNLMFPCILLTCIALLGFIVPPEAGEKISLEITVLLSLAVFLLVVSEWLPPTSETFPFIGMYFACCMVLVSFSTVLTVVVLNVHHKEYRRLPSWMKKVCFVYLARVVFFSNDLTRRAQRCQVEEVGDSHAHHNHHNHNGVNNKDSVKINGFFGNHNDGERDEKHPHQVISDLTKPDEFKTKDPATALSTKLGEDTALPVVDPTSKFAPLVHIMSQQLRLMQKADVKKEGKQHHDHERQEWISAAVILDRVFLLLFSIITFIASMALLVPLSTSQSE